ncbi:MAG: hypothetical protein WD771_00065 [Gemmatimonadaceae bacterium]
MSRRESRGPDSVRACTRPISEAAATPEARLAKALDKLETILLHTQGANPPGFDHRFNLGYGRGVTVGHPLIEALREILDRETERLAARTDGERTP